jgi:hypothetical protein
MGLETANLALAAYMTGVIWVVQLVVYPLFERVGAREWPAHHATHSRRITVVVAPAMLAHPVVAAVLLADRPGVLAAVNLALTGGLLVVTATVFARLHAGLEPGGVRRLVAWNALRAVAWTASSAVAVALLLSSRGR